MSDNVPTTEIVLPPLTEEEFYALPPHQQRVRLAREVLVLLRQHWLRASCGLYVADRYRLVESAKRLKADFQQTLRATPYCTACALGSLLLAKVRSYDRCSLEILDVDYQGQMRGPLFQQLAGIFSPEQLDLIECAFEMRDCPSDSTTQPFTAPQDARERAARMYGRTTDSDERLRDIMQNIVMNDGDFVVPEASA